MNPSIWLWLIVLIVGSFISGVIKSMLGIKIYSNVKYGVMIYGAIDSIIGAFIIYVLWSAIEGHWLQ